MARRAAAGGRSRADALSGTIGAGPGLVGPAPGRCGRGAAGTRAQQPMALQSVTMLSVVKRGPLKVLPKLPVQLVPS